VFEAAKFTSKLNSIERLGKSVEPLFSHKVPLSAIQPALARLSRMPHALGYAE
jgi:hypothetical protein